MLDQLIKWFRGERTNKETSTSTSSVVKKERALMVVDGPNLMPADVRMAYAQMKTLCEEIDLYVFIPDTTRMHFIWDNTITDLNAAIKCIPVYSRDKIAADSYMALQAVRLCLLSDYRYLGILSSDSDFIHTAKLFKDPDMIPLLKAFPVMFIEEAKSNLSILKELGTCFVKTPLGYERRSYSSKPRPRKKLSLKQ